MGRIYCVSCLSNGKLYVGITSGTVRNRWRAHVNAARRGEDNQVLSRGIRKHGVDQFTVEELFAYPTRTEAAEAEIALIDALDLRNPKRGYNLTLGGDLSPMQGRQHKPSSKAKMAAAKLGRRLTPDHKEKLRQGSIGKVFTEERRNKMRLARLGRSIHTAETRAKMAASRIGKHVHTEDSKRRIGEASRLRPRSQQTKDKISASIKRHWARVRQPKKDQ